MSTTRLIFVPLLFAFLASCGGGGGGGSSPQPPPITNQSPTIQEIGEVFVVENTLAVSTLTASDPDGDALTFSLSGADANLFVVSDQTVSFVSAPNFEAPSDSDTNNEYTFSVSVSDGQASASASVSAIVVDAHEGRVIDSPVSGAVVFIDLNGDKELAEGETEDVTDEEGYFSLARGDNDAGAVLVSKGGTDTRTGNLLSGVFISDVSGDPSAPQIISAISTLLSSLEVESDKTRLLEAMRVRRRKRCLYQP